MAANKTANDAPGQEDRGEEIATRADPPAAPGAHRVSGAARRPSDARMRGRGRTGCPPRLPCPHAVRRCRPDRRTDRTMRAAWPGNTALGATRSTRRHQVGTVSDGATGWHTADFTVAEI